MDKKFHNVTLMVDNKSIEVDISEELRNVDEIPNKIGYWGSVLSLSIAERIKAESLYRQWRSILVNQILQGNSKLAEWKVKAMVESNDDFLHAKGCIANTAYNCTFAKSMLEALIEKSRLAISEGKNEKTQGRFDGDIGKDGPYQTKNHVNQEKIQHMKEIFSNKKEKGVDNG